MGSLNPIYCNYSYCQVQVYHLTTLCFSNLFFVPFLLFFCIRLNQLKCLFFYISALLTCYNSVFFYCNGYFRFIVYVINLSQSVFIIIPLHIKYKHLKIYFHFVPSLLLTSIQFSLPVSQIPHYVVLFIKQFIFYGNINKKKKLTCICCSVTKSYPTLCDLMNCSTPGFPVLHYLPKFAQIHVH